MEPTVLRFGILELPVNSGFTELENAVGGFYGGEETVIVSPPNKGKTTLLGNIAYGIARNGHTVIYYTHEIGAERMLCRFYASMVRVETKNLSKEIYRIRSSLKRFRISAGGTVWVKFFPARTASIDTLRNHLSMVRGYDINPAAIIIDYAGLLRSRGTVRYVPRHEQLREIYEDLRAMADEFGVHVITASQSTRQTLYADLIDLDDTAESWGIPATADSMVFMCQGREEEKAGVLRLYVGKARNENRGRIVYCRADFNYLSIKEIQLKEYVKIMRAHKYPVNDEGRFTTGRRERREAGATGQEDSELRQHYER